MVAAAAFFKGTHDGDGLPYLTEYLLSLDGHGSWQELQNMPATVLKHWLVYRSLRIQIQHAESKSGK